MTSSLVGSEMCIRDRLKDIVSAARRSENDYYALRRDEVEELMRQASSRDGLSLVSPQKLSLIHI
eukprot:9153165-Prorocentrum_lima.AAC.1